MRDTRWIIAAASGLLAALALTSCGGPDADPRAALRAVCGEDSEITSEPPNSDPDDLVAGDKLSCEVDGHNAVAVQYRRDGLDTTEVEEQEYESGNGDQLAFAFVETDDGAGTAVYLYPPGLFADQEGPRVADAALLDPLAEDGWEIGPD